MQIHCRGWRRCVQNHRLMPRETDLSKVTRADDDELYHLGRDTHMQLQDDEVIVTSSVAEIKLNGNYWVDIHLTKNDIAALARLAFSNDRCGKVIELLTANKTAVDSKAQTAGG